MGTGFVEQKLDRLSHRTVVPAAVQRPKHAEAICDWTQAIRHRLVWKSKWMKSVVTVTIFQQRVIANGEERPSESGKDGELVVRPFNRRKCSPNGLHFLAIVERPAADEQMGKVTGLKGTNVRSHYVLSEAVKTAK